ncbi:MAG: chemotaxis protein CheX [Verrucomicrobiae bacterium]|nr:chemotaxis protein CheX [Verrucomicrobiae bacterium]
MISTSSPRLDSRLRGLMPDAAMQRNFEEGMQGAVSGVMATMLDLEIRTTGQIAPLLHTELVCGSVGFAGPGIAGTVYLMATDSLAAGAVARIFGGEAAKASEADKLDLVGELTNMIVGEFKSRCLRAWPGCHLTVPTVVCAPMIRIESHEANLSFHLFFQTVGDPHHFSTRTHILINQEQT